MIETHEERLVEDGTHGVVAACVDTLRHFEQAERRTEDGPAAVEALLDVIERILNVFAFHADSVDLGAQLVFGSAFLGSQIKKVVFFAPGRVTEADLPHSPNRIAIGNNR